MNTEITDKSFALNTYIDSCNGMCKRVLKDI